MEGGKGLVYPQCVNQKEARMVCLSERCQQHPFFCTSCEEPSCETLHTHDDKLASISFKEFTKRVLKPRKPVLKLSEAMESYKAGLEKLSQDVGQFIKKQLRQIEEIERLAETVDEGDQEMIVRLREVKYEGFTGKMLDHLWGARLKAKEQEKEQEETADFIRIKEDEVKGISEHFQELNQMDHVDKGGQTQQINGKQGKERIEKEGQGRSQPPQ